MMIRMDKMILMVMDMVVLALLYNNFSAISMKYMSSNPFSMNRWRG